MRKLTVKNFSVIKEAELEFGKITVLIGPQSSGKSLLCKLAFFLGQVVPEIAANWLSVRNTYQNLKGVKEQSLPDLITREFTGRFHADAWGDDKFEISYESPSFRVSIRRGLSVNRPLVEIDESFIDRIVRLENSIYIPAGRAFYSTPNKGFASFAGKNLDWLTQRFATEIDWEYIALIESARLGTSVLSVFGEKVAAILRGSVAREHGELLFGSNSGDRRLPFQFLSSGTQELLPLLNPISQRVFSSDVKSTSVSEEFQTSLSGILFVEEPEASVFPSTQHELVQLFAWLASDSILDFSWAITTHSPYILSSFNNLLEAWQVGHADDERGSAVRKVIDEQCWVNPDEFRAYAIKDGVLTSIIADDTRLISENYLDSVSETIGAEFDELLRIGYVEA